MPISAVLMQVHIYGKMKRSVSEYKDSLGILKSEIKIMAFGWITALKIIPWKDVLESAPHIVKAAKNIYAGTRTDTSSSSETTESSTGTFEDKSLGGIDFRLHKIEEKIQELGNEQGSSVELIRSLAKQNVRIVEVIEVLRVRTKILFVTCILFSSILAGLVFWLILK
jgi:hypothetical protein